MIPRVLILWGLLAALVGGAAYLLLSPIGLTLVWGQVRPYLAPTIQAEAVSGRLIGPVRIRGLTVSGETFRARLDRVELDWRPLRLLGGEVALDYFHGEGLHVTHLPGEAPPDEETATPGGVPGAWSPRLGLRVHDLDLRRITLRTAPEADPLPVGRLRASVGVGSEAIYARDIQVESPTLRLSGETTLKPSGDYPLEARLDWTLTLPDRPRLDGRTRIDGDLGRSLTLTQSVEPPLPLQAEIRIDQPLAEPEWQLTARSEGLDLNQLPGGLPPVEGDLRLEAAGDTANAEGHLTLQGHHPELGGFHTTADMEADLTEPQLVLHQLEAGAAEVPGRLTARGTISRPEDRLQLALKGDWSGLRWPSSGKARWRSPSGRWRLSGTPGQLSATLHGRVNHRGRMDAALSYSGDGLGSKIRWRHLTWPDRDLDLRSPDGELTLAGKPAAYRLRLDAGLAQGPKRSGRIRAEGRGDSEGLAVDRLRAELLGGAVDGEGKLAWSPRPEARLELEATELDPGRWLPRWPGSLGGHLAAEGRWAAEGPEVEVDRLGASGRLRGREVSLSGSGSYRPGRLAVRGLEVTADDTTATVSGRVGEELDLEWQLASPDLATVHPEAGGRLKGFGRVMGPRGKPSLRANLSGEELAFAAHRVGHLELDGFLDLAGAEGSDMQLAVDDALVAGRPLERLRLTLEGRPQEHTLRLKAASEAASVDTGLKGRWHHTERRWDFTLDRARIGSSFLPRDWHLAAPASGSAEPGRAELNGACFTTGAPRLCLSGQVGPDEVSGRYRADALPLGYLLPLLPPGTALEGRLGGSGDLAWEDGTLTGEAELSTDSGRLLYTEPGREPRPLLAFDPSHLQLTATPQAIRIRSELDLEGKDRVQASLRLRQDQGPLAEAPASGQLQGRITDLDVVPVFVTEVTELKGHIEANVRLRGSLTQPGWEGKASLGADRLGLISPGITLRDLGLSVESEAGDSMALSGSVRSGGGRLQLAGQARLTGPEHWATLRIWGEDFRIYDTIQAQVWVSPELSLALSGRDLAVNGEVRVPRSEIVLKDLPAKGAISVSGDQVIVRPQETQEEPIPWRVSSRVRLIMGDQVHFEGFGLSSRIAGDLTLVTDPERPTTASGELRTEEGKYRAYGQRLTIETGRLLFGGGPVSDPGLDVRAVRRPRSDILVGVRASGRLREPRFELFSEPAMGQTEQLSWLVLGRSLEDTSGGEHAALSRAALALGARGGAQVAETVGTELGLDEVGLETQTGETGEQAALVLGKHLSPRLYVSYGIGLFEAVNTLRMEYTLSEHWELVTESSTLQTGGDLFYTIESGK